MDIKKISADKNDWTIKGYVPNLPDMAITLNGDERWRILDVLLDCLVDNIIEGMKSEPETFKEHTGKDISEITPEMWDKCKEFASLNSDILVNYSFDAVEDSITGANEPKEDKVIPLKTKE